jgi:predicted nucleic-acid-binding protein
MIGLDTNVLVRYLAQDDPGQAAKATRLIERGLSESKPGWVGLVVLVETCWVLQALYHATPEELRDTVADLLDARQLVIENRGAVTQALVACAAGGADFADALIAQCARVAGCDRVVSFDRRAVRAGMELLK